MEKFRQESGFTLLEVLAVMIIIAALATISIPKLAASTADARRKADIATAHEVKAALDRYQVEAGTYPEDLTVKDGTVSCASLVPKYISKLDKSTTQQIVPEENRGFGLGELAPDEADNTLYIIPDDSTASNTIMIYLSDDRTAAEVRAYDEKLKSVLWTSAD